jgi:GntR family transcriptional regulator/MocR family aminotransferase
MPDDWANQRDRSAPVGGADLHLELTGGGLRVGLMEALRRAVRTGRLQPGAKLPSSRSLAADLGVARNTVADAYSELIAEGWLTAQQGSGTRVARRAEPRRVDPVGPRRNAATRPLAHGLMPGSPNLAEFPRTQWLAAARRAVTAAPDEAFGYTDPAGRIELREVLATYLARSRGVYADPGRIVICSGFHHGLTLVAQALRRRGIRSVAVEEYGFEAHRVVFDHNGIRTWPVTVDERGARTADLGNMRGVGAALLTPAHQYPTGVELSPERRAEFVNWARATGSLILEDDYDGEFRYDRNPVGALQSLDPGCVVYFGSASKSLAPGLRLAWIVIPEELVPDVIAAKGGVDWSSAFDQLTLAEFIASGAYDRHVRSMRLRYRRRRDDLIIKLAESAPGISVTGINAGLQALVELPRGTEGVFVRASVELGLAISGLAEYRHPKDEGRPPGRDALVVGYAAPSGSAWSGTIDALCRALASVPTG